MNLSNKESSNNIINNNDNDNDNDNDIKIEGFTLYIIDSKNKLKIQELKNYKEELKKYFGRKDKKDKSNEKEMINKSISTSSSKTNKSIKTKNNSEKLMSLFIEKLFPNCNEKSFSICKKISTQYFKEYYDTKIEINKIEQCINYIEKRKRKWLYSTIIEFNLDIIQNIGYILMMTYSKLGGFKINETKSLKENIDRISKDTQDPLTDFYTFAGSKKNPQELKKTQFWEKNSKN